MVVESMVRSEVFDDKKRVYYYRMTKNEMVLTMEGESATVQTYGIEIERHDMVDGTVVNTEEESIETISPQRHKVHNLLKLLYDNLVSPVHLIDILGEYIDEYVIDYDEIMQSAVN